VPLQARAWNIQQRFWRYQPLLSLGCGIPAQPDGDTLLGRRTREWNTPLEHPMAHGQA